MAAAAITWRLHVRATSTAAVHRVLERVAVALGVAVEPQDVERYWKDPRDYVVTFTTVLAASDPAGGVFEALTRAGQLRSGWQTGVPQVEADGSWSFDMCAQAEEDGGGFTVPGVMWAHVIAEAEADTSHP